VSYKCRYHPHVPAVAHVSPWSRRSTESYDPCPYA
jgi:hypothetical protein